MGQLDEDSLNLPLGRRFTPSIEGCRGGRRPFQNLPGPTHAQVVVHPVRVHHLLLPSVPQLNRRLSPLQLLEAAAKRARICGVIPWAALMSCPQLPMRSC
jgi:hypothetical protein